MANDKYKYEITSSRVLEYEKDAEALNKAISHHLNNADQLKWRRALSWFRNINFYAGNHYDTFRYSGNGLVQSGVTIPPQFQSVLSPTLVDNRIIKAVQYNISSLTSFNPTPQITPASLSPDDAAQARISALILKILWERPLSIPAKLREAVLNALITGTSALEVTFGPLNVLEERLKKLKVKTSDILGQERESLVDSDESEWVHRDGLKVNVYSGFHLDFNPDASVSPDSLSWVCRSTYEDATLIKRLFDCDDEYYLPQNLEKIKGGEGSNHPLWYAERIKGLVDGEGSNFNFENRVPEQTVLVRYIDTLPNEEFPLGRTLIQAGGQLVYAGKGRACSEKYRERWHPYSFFRWNVMAGRFEGSALITELVKHQKRINALDSLIRLSREHNIIGGWFIHKRHKVPEGFIGGSPGQNVTLHGDATTPPPARIPHQVLPSDIWEERALHAGQIDSLAGIVNAGAEAPEAQSALRSGNMLAFFERQASAAKSATMREFEESIDHLGQNILIEANLHMADNAELRRRVLVAARNESDLAIERFNTLDIRDNIHVSLDIRAQQSQTPEAKKEAASLFLQYAGQQMSPVERAKIAQMMGLDEIDTQTSPDYTKASTMVERILQNDVSAAGLSLDGVDDPVIFSQVIRQALLSEKAVTASKDAKEALLALFEKYKSQIPPPMPMSPAGKPPQA